MRVEILSKNYKPEENFKELLTKKLSKFDKYFEKEGTTRIKLSTANGTSCVMEATIVADGKQLIRAVATAEKMNEGIDILLPKLERQIVKYRGKIDSRLKKSAFETPSIYPENEAVKAKAPRIVKEKRFNVSVTTVENAVEEMEMLSHNFYVFVNGDTNKVGIVYKRNDGDYGLIEPEY